MNIHLEQTINAPADKVWAVLAHQFVDVADWASTLEYSRAITHDEIPDDFEVATNAPVLGRATPNPLGELIEVLTVYTEEDKKFTFLTAGLPPIIRRMENTTQVMQVDEDHCLVTFKIQGELKGIFKVLDPLLSRRFATSQRGPAGILKDLKMYAESM